MNNLFLSCDWGTSTLRLRLLDVNSDKIHGEVITENGIAKSFESWVALEEQPDRFKFFQNFLVQAIARLESECGLSCQGHALIISGMASSSIGMTELPYAKLPLMLNEQVLSRRFFPANDAFPYDTLLISGISSEDDVMRGEETELLGLVSGMRYEFEEGVYIFPGTHSKHIAIKNKEVVGFHTFMTGELFNLLTSRSTLQASVKKPEKFSKAYQDAFIEGVKMSQKQNFLTGLFKTRTNQLLGKLDEHQNFHFLSGLLIGTELSDTIDYKNIIICASAKFSETYRLGAEVLGLLPQCHFVPAAEVALLVCEGHKKIYQNTNFKHHA